MKPTSRFPVTVLVVLAVVTLFVVQNLSPSLAVTFLGFRSLALPVGVWVAGAFVVGWLVAWIIWLMLGRIARSPAKPGKDAKPRNWVDEELDPTPPPRRERRSKRQVAPAPEPTYEEPRYPQAEDDRTVEYAEYAEYSEYEAYEEPTYDDREVWDEEDWPEGEDAASVRETPSTGFVSYEVEQKPVPSYRQGSLYSYSYEKSQTPEPEVSEPVEDTEPEPEDVPTPPLDKTPIPPPNRDRSVTEPEPDAEVLDTEDVSPAEESWFDDADIEEEDDIAPSADRLPEKRSGDDWLQPPQRPENW